MKPFKIELVESDFDGANYMSNDDCPIARGLKRKFPNASIDVSPDNAIINNVPIKIHPDDDMYVREVSNDFGRYDDAILDFPKTIRFI